jgi:cellulose synthase operon protein C
MIPMRSCRFALITSLSLALLTPIAGGCRPQARDLLAFDQSAAAEHAARLEKWLGKHPDDHAARLELAHVYWLHLAAPDQAVAHLDRLTALERPAPLARYARFAIAQGHLDLDRAWLEAAALLREAPAQAKREDRELALALASPVARSLSDLESLRVNGDKDFVALYDSLDLDAHRGETVEQLVSLRADIARRRGDDYRPFYARQGCVQDWVVGPVEGHRGALELLRLAGDFSFTADPGAQPTQLSCAFRIWNPEPRAGIRRLRTTVEVPAGDDQFRLSIGAQYPSRVYVDDSLVWASDRTDQYPTQSPTFVIPAGPGAHRVEVRTAIPSERAWVLIRATDQSGRPLKSSADAQQKGGWSYTPPAERNPEAGAEELLEIQPWLADAGQRQRRRSRSQAVYAPLWAFLAVEDALADGDTDRAELLADELRDLAEGFADAHFLLADFEHRDPSRGRTSSGARQQAELEITLALDPAHLRAQLSLLSMRLDRGEVPEVVAALEALPELGMSAGGLLVNMLRYEAYRRRGSDYQAEQALERAAAIHPGSCDVLMARRSLIRERNQVVAEDQIAQSLARCGGSLRLRARLAVERQRFDEAEALWVEQLARIPDDIDAMEALAELAVAAGRYDEAAQWQRKMLSLAPYRALSHIELADLEARASQPRAAREHVLAAIDRFPHNSRLRQIGERVGIPDELMRWRIDGMQALADYRRDLDEGLAAAGVAEVLLLDREVSMLFPDGSHRHIVHQMYHVLSDRSIDAHGEFNPGNVQLLTMHSIKPDGTIVEPESIAGKDGLSLRGLEIGDVVEIELMFDASPQYALPGHVDLGRFRFQSPEIPFHRSELIALIPAAMEPKVAIEARNDAPKPSRKLVRMREGALANGERPEAEFVELSFRADRVERLGSEPMSRSMLDELPMIQLHVPLDEVAWLDQLAAELRPSQRSNPELRKLAAELTQQYDDDYAKLDALWRWVVDEIEDDGGITTPATASLAARQGGRLMVLRALAQAAGLPTELWLLRDRFGPTILPGGDPLVDTYDTAMLALVEPDKPPLLVGTSSKVVPLGYLSPSYADGRGLRLQLERDEPAAGAVKVPSNLQRYRDLRRWDLEITLDAQGRGRVRGSIELRGLEAVLWRDAFDKIDESRLPEVFTQAELGRLVPNASLDLEALDFENQWELDEPLIIRFSATARNIGVVEDKQIIMLAAAVPIDQATGYTRLPTRWSGMAISYAPVLEAKVRYVLDGASFAEVPPDVSLEDPRGSYQRKLVSGGVQQSELVLESRSTLVPGIVEAGDYRKLTEFALHMQRAEQQLLRAR